MATAKWATPGSVSSNLAGTALNSLANGSTSAFITYDNSTNLDLYASVNINLASFTSTTNASVTLRVFSSQSSTVPDTTGSVGGGDIYVVPITVGASAKTIVVPMIRLYPESLRICVTNNTGAAWASSGHTLYVRPYNESAA